MDARDWLPQSRARMFLVAVRADVPLPPRIQGSPHPVWHPSSVRTAFDALPSAVRTAWRWWRMPRPRARPVRLESILEADGPYRWAAPPRLAELARRMRPEDFEELRAARRLRRRAGITISRKGNGKDARHQQVSFDGLARCLCKGDGFDSQHLIVHADNEVGFAVRPFTPR